MSDVVFIDNTFAVKEALGRVEEKFLTEAATLIEAQVKQNWKHVVDTSKHEAIIGNPLENAVWEEFGTGEYALNGNGRKGGWVYCIDNGNKITRNKDGSMRKNSKYKKEK